MRVDLQFALEVEQVSRAGVDTIDAEPLVSLQQQVPDPTVFAIFS